MYYYALHLYYDRIHLHNKALRLYYEDDNGSKLPHDQLSKIARILTALDAVTTEDDVKHLGLGIHKLSGNMKDFWSLKVSANYKIVFRFEDGNVFDVDYMDYH